MTRRPIFWILLAAASIAAAAIGIRYFPDAFSIVALEITMDRERALEDARAIMSRDNRGPVGYRQAASFGGDEEAQYFVELEGGGKEVLTAMLRDELYAAYTWRVRNFKEGETNETLIRFTPSGRPYGFVERLKEDAPGAELDPAAARALAEEQASGRWGVDFASFEPVEQGQERRTGGRVDHTFTYERPSPTLNDGRYRLRLVVSGDRLTELTHFIKVPEAFSRRYASMRAANEAVGYVAVVGLAVLYVFVGIGFGLFVMLRQRWVLWRTAAYWGAVIGLLQALTAINEFPLLWMSYDTAVPQGTFVAGQIAIILATFLGFSAFFALSFMAAETLGRRAFGRHPQLWRIWSTAPGSSKTVLGHTAAGYLLVAIFFAYDVVLYLVMTNYFGWWSPSEALLHPDVLATYVPALSALANSLQAGFWEEALFRAVPLAGAALIGDRFGRRTPFLIAAFIVQAIIFGAGHAPYPNQPFYARPVELIIPSIGFGLLYIYWGLLPGIILHFAFDVVWFALPIFLADAPGIWVQQVIVVVLTLVPLWIVLWRRMQAGRWTELAPEERNAAWRPAPPVATRVEIVTPQHGTLPARAKTVWLVLGVISLMVVIVGAFSRPPAGGLSANRHDAEKAARDMLTRRGASLGDQWHVMPVPNNGSVGPHEFVSETAGEERRRELLGTYLPSPRWSVRVASFDGDVADRAEEWQVLVTAEGEARSFRHTLPEGRSGASLDEKAARGLAKKALAERFGASSAMGMKEISARPSKLKARTDWTFTFVDTTIPPLPEKGEPRVAVEIAGDEVAAAGRFVFVPEEWQRLARAADTRNLILQVLAAVVFGSILATSGVFGMIAWSRRRYTARLFFAAAGVMFLVRLVQEINDWPATLAGLPTFAPLKITVPGVAATGLVGLAIIAVLVGLPMGHLRPTSAVPVRDAERVAVSAGLFGGMAAAVAGWLMTPAWARFPDVASYGTLVPLLQTALNPIAPSLTQTATVLALCLGLERLTASWSRRRGLAIMAVAIVGFLTVGAPIGGAVTGWAAAGLVMAAAAAVIYATVIRFDLAVIPLTVATALAVQAIGIGAQRPFPGALVGAIAGAALTMFVGWWLFRALRAVSGLPAAGSAKAGPA
jgi:hypothetical protein